MVCRQKIASFDREGLMILRVFRNSFLLFLMLFLFVCAPGRSSRNAAVQKTVLPNGLIILHSEDRSLPFVSLELLVDGGSRRDPQGQEGLARLAADGLLLGTAGHTMAAINEELDFMGASLTASSGRDYSMLTLRVLKKDIDGGLALFREVLTEPTFPEDEIKRELEKTMAAIQSQEDQPGAVAEKEFQKALFIGNPYGHPTIGTKESLPGITREGMVNFYKAYYHPNNYILAVVGDISPQEVKTKIVPLFEKMEAVADTDGDIQSGIRDGH